MKSCHRPGAYCIDTSAGAWSDCSKCPYWKENVPREQPKRELDFEVDSHWNNPEEPEEW